MRDARIAAQVNRNERLTLAEGISQCCDNGFGDASGLQVKV